MSQPTEAAARAESIARRVRHRLRIRPERVRESFFATGATFFFTGAVFGTWAARIPAFKDDLGLTNGELAVAFITLEAAAVLGLQLGGFLVPKVSSRRALAWALPAFGLSLAVLGTVPNLVFLAAVLAAMGIANSVVDIAINASGVAVQYLSGRSVMSRMHAMHSVGGIVGAGVGAAFAALDVSRACHFIAVGLIIAIASALTSRRLLPPRVELRAGTEAIKVTAENAGVAPENRPDTAEPIVGWRSGWSRQLVFVGFVLLGLGLSVTLPVAISAAGSLPGLAMATAVSRVSTMGYLGSFVAPAVIGALAGPLTLGWALAGSAVLVLLTLPAARLLSQATPESRAAAAVAEADVAVPSSSVDRPGNS
jgi:hypothetical protein